MIIKTGQALAQLLAQSRVLGLPLRGKIHSDAPDFQSGEDALARLRTVPESFALTLPFDSIEGAFSESTTNFKRSSITKHRPRKPNIAIASIAHDGLCVGPYSLPSTVSVSERPSCGLTSFIQRAKFGGHPAYGTVDTQKHSLGLSY
jgi:hypothetical protein